MPKKMERVWFSRPGPRASTQFVDCGAGKRMCVEVSVFEFLEYQLGQALA
jgi:hypothetical protein